MTAKSPIAIDLAWHASWVTEFAQKRAVEAFALMDDAHDRRDHAGLWPYERVGLDLSKAVGEAMAAIEPSEFVKDAQIAAIELFLQHLYALIERASYKGVLN